MTTPTDTRDESLQRALLAVEQQPEREENWDELERVGRALQRPDDVGVAYRAALTKGGLDADIAGTLGRRAVAFHEEWSGDQDGLGALLDLVLRAAPDTPWAFERLTMLLTVGERWDELLGLYDRALAAMPEADVERRRTMLEEAANVAKDFASQPERAIRYLEAQFAMDRANVQVARGLERLYERYGRARDLIALWRARLPFLAPDAAHAARARIATVCIDTLREPAEALTATEDYLAHGGDEAVACGLLERVAAFPSPDVARRAVALLQSRYEAAGRTQDVLRVLRLALDVAADDASRATVRRELARRLLAEGKTADAVDHVAALVVLDPTDADSVAQLYALADKTGRHDRLADALAQGSDVLAARPDHDDALRLSLLQRAGDVRSDVLSDADGAAALYTRVLAATDPPDDIALPVARRLASLLDALRRAPERLDVLERLGALETNPDAQRAALGDAARLAESLGDTDRALRAWKARLAVRADDAEALDAMVELLERGARWSDLVATLRARASLGDDETRRGDLVRIARTYAGPLARPDAAIEAWDEVRAAFGEDPEVVDALAELLALSGRWDDLLALLGRASAREADAQHRATLLRRAGDVHRLHRGDNASALRAYCDALTADPSEPEGRAGLAALLIDPQVHDEAVRALAVAYAATDDWQETLDLLEHRLSATTDPEAQARVLMEASALRETRADERAAALSDAARALPLATKNPSLLAEVERELERLAARTGKWAQLVEAYRAAIEAARGDNATRSRLAFRLGVLLEEKVGDAAAALDAYLVVAREDRSDLRAAQAVVRVAGQIGEWSRLAAGFVATTVALGDVDETLVRDVDGAVTTFESRQGVGTGWEPALAALGAAVAEVVAAPALLRRLETQIGVWHRDRRDDPWAAETALTRAVRHDGAHAETLQMLADLQRRAPGRPLVDTLGSLAELLGEEPAGLDALREAATVARDTLRDGALSRSILSKLLERGAGRWEALELEDSTDAPQAREHAAWALRALVDLYASEGDHDRAVTLLVAGSKLPFTPPESRALRHEAAERAARDLGDAARAMQLYETVLHEAPDDLRAVTRLAALYEAGGLRAQLLALRRHQLSLAETVDARLPLRLEVARILEETGDDEGRERALLDNLGEQPGHPASVEALAQLLGAQKRHAELLEILTGQAREVEQRGREPQVAVSLWHRAARLAESELRDVPRAISAYEKVVARSSDDDALDALARLHADRGEHARAVVYLERRLEKASGEARRATVVRLAKAHLATAKVDLARETLEGGLARDPGAAEVHAMLATLYRDREAWEPLAALLSRDAPERRASPAELREAADILLRRLRAPDRAIPVLERALRGSPDDRALRAGLADALRAAGRLDEAKAMLDALVESYGRQRPHDRAVVHFQLAQIAQSRGDVSEALAQLELASGIDLGHAGIYRLLGDTAREAGQLERAERAYRALLMIVRRQAASGTPSPDLPGPSEVLFELYRIATAMGQTERAKETLETTFETAMRNVAEARRFERALRQAGEHEMLLRTLEARLAQEQEPEAAAEILADMADVLHTALHRDADALDALLRALAQSPSSDALHDRALALARTLGQVPRYADTLATLETAARDAQDLELLGSLSLRHATVAEEDLHDPDRAAQRYEAAESDTEGARLMSVWRGLDRVYGARGDRAGQARVLRKLVDADGGDAVEYAYRLAAIQLGANDEIERDQGVDWLTWAFERTPDLDRVTTLLRGTMTEHPSQESVMHLYERVAREGGDGAMLLDALVRKSTLTHVPIETLREGVDLAQLVEEPEVAESLLKRAVELARDRGEPSEIVWALVSLSERRRAAGDVTTAVQFLREAAEVAEPVESFQLGLQVAQLAVSALNDLPLAAQTYELLRQRDPAERTVWEPLMEVYRWMGDTAGLERVIDETVQHVFDQAGRNRLRLERVRILLDRPDRIDDAAQALRDVLDEDPEDLDATSLLADLYARTGRDEELAELLMRQFDAARERKDASTTATLGLRLAGLLAPTKRQGAIDVLRLALDTVADDRAVLRRLLSLMNEEDPPEDRAEVMERLLHLETGAEAAALALELSALRSVLGDEAGAERALSTGFRAMPTHEVLRTHLETRYAGRDDFAALAELKEIHAAHLSGSARAEGLRDAAVIHRDNLGHTERALSLFRAARADAPDDLDLLAEYVRCLGLSGAYNEAIAEVTRAIDGDVGGEPMRAPLLQLRAEMNVASGDEAAAVADLDKALALAGDPVVAPLVEVLETQRAKAKESGARDLERAATLRLVELLPRVDREADATALLQSWSERDPDDTDTMRRVAERHAAASRWDDAAAMYQRLFDALKGEGRVGAAVQFADMVQNAGRPDDARPVLEAAYRENPSDATLRARLRALQEALGMHREVARLWLDEAGSLTDEAAKFSAYRRAGEVLLDLAGDAIGAVGALEQAWRLKPADHDTIVALSDAYTVAERLEDASRLLNDAIATHRNRRSKELAVLQHRMGRLAYAAGDHQVEMAWLNAALDTDMQNGQIAAELADVSMELQNHEVALKALRAITLMKNPQPMSRAMAFLRQGMIANQQSDAKKAVFLARKALAEDSALAEAHAFLKELGAE